jgi:hydrogenase expression/formation protein HypE
MIQFPETGKIQDEFFKALVFPYCGTRREEVVIQPQYGVDVSLITLPNGYEMALTSDPLTLIPTLGLRESAWLSVVLMSNDMATTGKAPMYAQFVLNLPASFPPDDFEQYWKYIHRYCEEMGTAITGGHTGRFEGQNGTVAGGGTMVTIAPAGEMLTSKGASAGDVLLVTKESAMIATSILALSYPTAVANRCGKDVQQKASELFYETTALKAGMIAASMNTKDSRLVTAMHDVTEGGILGAIHEMALAAGCGVLVEEGDLPVGEVQKQVCAVFDIDPLYSIGAGCMIMSVQPGQVQTVVDALHAAQIGATVVGSFVTKEEGIHLISGGVKKPFRLPSADPYWKAFNDAFAQGLK